MKFLLALAFVLASAVIVYGSKAEASSRSDFEDGSIGPGDLILHRCTVIATALPDEVQTQEVNYTNNEMGIRAIIATEIGAPQNGTVRVTSGGVGWTGANIRFQSQAGNGYHYQLDVWGRPRGT